MGRPKGSKNKKGKKFEHDPAKVAALLGISVEDAAKHVEKTKAPDQLQNEAEAVLAYAYNVGTWYNKKCKECKSPFVADYNYIAFCSMRCRKKQMTELGLGWNPSRSEDQRWEALGIQTPAIVTPAALSALKVLALHFQDHVAPILDDETIEDDASLLSSVERPLEAHTVRFL